MEKLKIIFNGRPRVSSDNLIRAGIALVIFTGIGMGGGALINNFHPEWNNVPGFLAAAGNMCIGIIELLRQHFIADGKYDNMVARQGNNVLRAIDEQTNRFRNRSRRR